MLSLDYILDDVGWADCRISYGEHVAEFRVSYLSDPLYDLAMVACSLLASAGASPLKEYSAEGIIHFGDEPGIHLLVLDLAHFDDRAVALDKGASIPFRLLYHPNMVGPADPTDMEQTLFEGTVTVGGFTRMVFDLLIRILSEYGFSGYRNRWLDCEFPLTQTARLAALLGESSLPVPLK